MRCTILLFVALSAIAGPQPRLPIVFEQNRGQTAAQVRYIGRAPAATLWLLDSRAVLRVDQKNQHAVVTMQLNGANRHPVIEAERALSAHANYFIGNDPEKWETNVPLFGVVRYKNVYPGIDLVFHGEESALEYDWILAPGADPRAIRMSFRGPDRLLLDNSGDLVLDLGDAQIRHNRPRLYQDGHEIAGRFVRRGRSIGFEVASYDPSKTLTIDPVLSYASYLAGPGAINSFVAIDPQGMLLLVGSTSAVNLSGKNGVYLSPPNRNGYVFLAKIDPTQSIGASLVWLTFLGGNYSDFAEGVATDKQGAVYVAGITYSSNFPVMNAFQSTFGTTENCLYHSGKSSFTAVCADAFVAKLAPTGDALVYSSYLGGMADDEAHSITVGSSGEAYVVGLTGSPNFAITPNAYQSKLKIANLQNGWNGFVTEISPTGALAYSTFIGGEQYDLVQAVGLDSQGNIDIAGATTSLKFPTVNALAPTHSASAQDGFVAKLNPALSGNAALLYSTFLGGAGGDTNLLGLSVDPKGNIYTVGGTSSANYPVTMTSALQSTLPAAPYSKDPNNFGLTPSAVITELNPAASGSASLLYSTYFGGTGYQQAYSAVLDTQGKLIVVGGTDAPDFPITPDGFEQVYPGVPYNSKSFVAKIDTSVSGSKGLLYSSYLGGSGNDLAQSVSVNATSITVAGITSSPDFPVTASGYQSKYGLQAGQQDAFIASFNTTEAAPSITAITNAASFLPAGPGAAPGEMVTLFGSNLGPATLVGSVLDKEGKIPTTVEGCQVLVNGTPAPIIYVWTQQATVLLPYELTPVIGQTNPVYAQVICNGIAGGLFPLEIVSSAPGIFSAGNGQAAVLNSDGSANSDANPAAKGSIVQIFATGEGVLNPAGQDGKIENGPTSKIPQPVLPVSVTFAGIASPNIEYAGVAPDAVDGLLQVNAQIPAKAPSGKVAIVLIVGTAQSQLDLNIAVK